MIVFSYKNRYDERRPTKYGVKIYSVVRRLYYSNGLFQFKLTRKRRVYTRNKRESLSEEKKIVNQTFFQVSLLTLSLSCSLSRTYGERRDNSYLIKIPSATRFSFNQRNKISFTWQFYNISSFAPTVLYCV